MARIEPGAIPQGAKLPTETELRGRHEGAAGNTVRDAIKLLEPSRTAIRLPAAGHPGLADGGGVAQVANRRQELLVGSRPLSLRAGYYPFDFAASGATGLVRAGSLPGGTASYLEQRLGLVQAGYRDRFRTRRPAKAGRSSWRHQTTGASG
jgi:hypothetical protein